MKKSLILLIWLSTVALAASLRGQAFTNLNFESAQVVFTSTNGIEVNIAAASALPGWSTFSGTNQLSQVGYNPSFAAIPLPVDLVGSNASVIDGNFSVLLFDNLLGNTGFISQTGLVPNDAKSLPFDATLPPARVSLGGQSLSFIAISNALNSSGHSYTIYGADISGFGSQEETLTFSGACYLDNIQFSTTAIPEPSAISIVCLGSGVLVYLRRKYRC
jgi:hypothetical protein